MRKKFNITGTCFPDEHYMADISAKLKATLEMVERGEYFIINRPRQYGKTTMLNTVADALAKDYIVFNISFEGTGDEFFRNEQNLAKGFLRQLKNLSHLVAPHLLSLLKDLETETKSMDELSDAITTLVVAAGKKVILQIDEVDKSANNELFIGFLGMLRQKYLFRKAIPTFHSVVLAGLHDIKTLKAKIRPESEQKYNSPWNIAADYRVNMNLLIPEIVPMLEEYKQDRGVEMNVQVIAEQLFYYTSGYPFLVSKLCKDFDEIVLPEKEVKKWEKQDTEFLIKDLIVQQNTNFDSQLKNLENDGDLYDLVYRIVIDNDDITFNPYNPIVSFGVLYGLLVNRDGKIKIHNRIYVEAVTAYMISKLELSKHSNLDYGVGYKNPNGSLNMEAVLLGFQTFMKKEYSKKDRDFLEKHGRLVFLAFIKPIINGKGYDFKEPQISDEKRLDVVITYLEKKYIAELKLWRGEKAHQEGLKQLHNYLDVQNLNEGYLIIFDHSEVKKWQSETIQYEGKTIMMVWV